MSEAISVFYMQDSAHGRNAATSRGFVEKVTGIFKRFDGKAELDDKRGLKSVLLICKSTGVDTSDIEEFVPLGT